MLLTIISYVLEFRVPLHRFPHVVGILTIARRVRGVVTVIILNHAENAVTHALVESYSLVIARTDEKVDEPGVVGIGGGLQLFAQDLANAEPPRFWRNGQGSDVSVPRKVMFGIFVYIWR